MKFIKAELRKLVMVNYVVSPEMLLPFLPQGTELDTFKGKHFISLVGFMFKNTKVLGFKFPGLTNFEEVNLRFYVKRSEKDGSVKRGVVFIQEIVPKLLVTWVANTLYKEHYSTRSMSHLWEIDDNNLQVSYSWLNKHSMEAQEIKVITHPKAEEITEGSIEEFISEHYWGYTKVNEKKTFEYQVEYPRWDVFPVLNYKVKVDFSESYGQEFEVLNNTNVHSCFLVEGSEISVNNKMVLNNSY